MRGRWGRGSAAVVLREGRRQRESALRKARRQEQLVSKRLLREESAAVEGLQDGAEIVPGPLAEDEVLELLRGVQRGSEDRKRSLRRLHLALQNQETQQKFVRMNGSIRTLVGLFTSSLADMQMEAARCLHELSHSSDPMVAEACLPLTSYLLTYLSGHSVEFTELCLYTLGNLVVESEAVRKRLLPQGIIPVLASCIQSPHEAVLEGLGYVLSQLLQAKEAPAEIIPPFWSDNIWGTSRPISFTFVSGARCLVLDSALPQHMLRLVCSGLKSGTGAAVEFAWSLHYMVCSHTADEALLSLGAVPALTLLLLDLAATIQDTPEGLELLICPVLRCLSNLLAGETGCEAQIQDERLLIALFLIMEHFVREHPFIVQEGLWLLNNLTADKPFFCSALLSLDLLPAVLQLLQCSQMATVLALTVLCNLAARGPAHCQQLHQHLLLPQLLPVLALPDPEAVGQSLELLHLLFLHCPEAAADFVRQGGHWALERHRSSPALQERAQALLDTVGQLAEASAFPPAHTTLPAFS